MSGESSVVDALEALAPAGKPGAKRWRPPPEAVPSILSAHQRGVSPRLIAKALTESGVSVCEGTIRRWVEENE